MRKLIPLTAFFLLLSLVMPGQQKIEFPSKDGVSVSADLYLQSDTLPYMILCHQAGASRGEYSETAKRFEKFMYNCLAIDQRSGDVFNGIKNETAIHAKEKKKPCGFLDSEQDILAAIDYAFAKSKKKVILVGSSYSASLVLKIAAKDERVKAVMAFSPGEYFGKSFSMKESVTSIPVPVFTASSQEEGPAVSKLMEGIKVVKKQQFTPASKGDHGAKALCKENQNAHEYWLAILMFMRSVK